MGRDANWKPSRWGGALARTGLVLTTLTSLALVVRAQEPPPTSPPASVSPAPAPVPVAEGFEETVDVRLVELYVVVTGKDGQLVSGLKREDFTVLEAGVTQPLEAVLDTREVPVTVGLAVDTSASMFVKLGSAVQAARALVQGLTRGRDRSFLVGFGPAPELIHPLTPSLDRVSIALADLEADGKTPLWGSIEYALGELERARGKRALVVFTDGADQDGGRAFSACLKKAREVGAPVYLVVMNNEAARSEGGDFQTRLFLSRLERVAKAGGGRVHYVSTRDDLTPIYRQIDAELRSAYLLTYYPVARTPGARPKIEVQLGRKDLRVRTVTNAPVPARRP
jgi:Ca-activated chloride channel homolog